MDYGGNLRTLTDPAGHLAQLGRIRGEGVLVPREDTPAASAREPRPTNEACGGVVGASSARYLLDRPPILAGLPSDRGDAHLARRLELA